MKLSARILGLFLFLFVFSLGLFLTKSPTYASASTPMPIIPGLSNPNLAPNTNADVPQNLHTYSQSVVIDIMASIVCQLAGVDPLTSDHKCLGLDSKTGKLGFVDGGGGAIGLTSTLIAATFTPPVSSVDYVKYLGRNFGVAQKAYAADCADPAISKAGLGFCGLSPIQDIWIAMRNIVYLLFVVIFVVIGVAIMLRVHIDPRTVMTIQNQIPKIIIGIVLVTFSLAIAGFLIDLMYIVIYLIGSVLGPLIHSTSNVNSDANTVLTNYGQLARSQGVFDAYGSLQPLDDTITKVTHAISDQRVRDAAGHITYQGGLIQQAGYPEISFFGVDLSNIVAQIVVWVLVLLALFYALIRVWVMLIISYISILLNVVFAPFWFLAGLVPGASMGIGGWFRDIIANLAVFPVTIAMFTLSVIFSDRVGAATGTIFNPPMVGLTSGSIFSGLLAFGFLFMTPEVLKMTKSVLKAPKLDLGPIFKPAGAAVGSIKGGASTIGVIKMKTAEPGKAQGFQGAIRKGLGI